LVALKSIREGINRTLQEGLQVEQEAALEVLGSSVSAGLIGVFFMQQELARDRGIEDKSIKPRDVKRVGVLGAGLMGAGIATAHARSGIAAGIVDIDDARLADGLKRASKVVSGRIKAGRASHEDLAFMLGNLSTSTSSSIFADCDVVVEAVTENEGLKKKLYSQLSEVMRDDAILGSNTSTISITRMAEAAPNPQRFVGMHFFLPVDRMQLVEVIRGEKTDDETVATIVALAKRIKKTPIVMKDCPGFLVNRILLPYMNEALVLMLEGASMDQIDKAATRFGMPVGPIALQDMVGLDTSYFAGKVLLAAYSDRAVEMPMLEKLVESGRLGKKSGAGFRKYTGPKGKPQPDPELEPLIKEYIQGEREFSNQELEDRLFLPMLLEGTRCLEEEIVRAPSHVDMGMILGTGFPPFRGGLLRWGDRMGAGKVIEKLSNYRQLGKRYEPTDMLENLAKTGKTFYPTP
jgi:3-hydroxyacyl-CoA dehydrogenase/enoyl-CoA hydratase/3-hydroxybutyryl-CoA epimerase/3-hydroxyacyl-CoA dehydrogenase/enoyl-CoA hydratase/3-hydroxybutyryl-CoA epimerase/enoyl-CoA isomerase